MAYTINQVTSRFPENLPENHSTWEIDGICVSANSLEEAIRLYEEIGGREGYEAMFE